MLEVFKKTVLPGGPQAAWAALTGWDNYESWNPVLRRIDGDLAVGATITLHVEGPAGARAWDVTVSTLEAGRAYGWRFIDKASWLYRGEHIFRLEDTADGVVFTDRERFWGLLVPFRSRGLRGRIRASMDSMSEALTKQLTSPASEGN